MSSTSAQPCLHHLAAFTTTPAGGNPAGVWIGPTHPPDDEMQAIAAGLGYSETAFLSPSSPDGHWDVRYFSPLIEVDFCGHATIASALAIDGEGSLTFHTNVGEVPIERTISGDHRLATLTSPDPRQRTIDPGQLDAVLATFGWTHDDLDPDHLPDTFFAGEWHLVLPVRSRSILGAMRYDFDELAALMTAERLTTIQVVWREHATRFHSRNPFPVGGIVEDPATGAAAAALGAYLRYHDLVPDRGEIEISQGVDMGRPSQLFVQIPPTGGMRVRGTAVPVEG